MKLLEVAVLVCAFVWSCPFKVNNMIQTTFDTQLECKVSAMCIELSMNNGEKDHF